MGILPFLSNDFETMTGKSDGQLYFVSGFMCVLYTGVILFKGTWISETKSLEYPSMLIFYDNSILVFRFWGLGKEQVFTRNITMEGDIQYLEPGFVPENKRKYRIEIKTEDAKHLAYLQLNDYSPEMINSLSSIYNSKK